jgi:hypothetical protein
MARMSPGITATAHGTDGKPVPAFFNSRTELLSEGTVVKVISDGEGDPSEGRRKVAVGVQDCSSRGLAAQMYRFDLRPWDRPAPGSYPRLPSARWEHDATACPRSLMPRQNRVTPFGEIVAVLERGTVMGNRGRLHDEKGMIRRPWQVTRWLLCRLELSLRSGRWRTQGAKKSRS